MITEFIQAYGLELFVAGFIGGTVVDFFLAKKEIAKKGHYIGGFGGVLVGIALFVTGGNHPLTGPF